MADAIRLGANGQVRVAPAGTALPTDFTSAYGTGWIDLGRCDENGAQVTDSKTIVDIPVWQSFYPGRKIVTARAFEVVFTLRDWTRNSVSLAFGGGTWAMGTGADSAIATYTPPTPGSIDLRTLAVD